ncbi:MAG: GPR endopeptidase [Lachnospiraceae bacterium]
MEQWKKSIYTDLAVEERESFPGDGGEIPGVSLREWEKEEAGIHLTEVVIKTEEGAGNMGKPMGTYVTLEALALAERDEDFHREVSEELAARISGLLALHQIGTGGNGRAPSILAVGWNENATDAPGLWCRSISRPRHLTGGCGEEFAEEKYPPRKRDRPGVMAQTGMETAEILKGVIAETRPDAVLAVDALAARSVRRLGVTIQLSDAGIHPGSGVGNHRNSLTRETLGVPVIAIGVPTVVGAAAIVHDTVGALVAALKEGGEAGYGDMVEHMDGRDQYQLIREVLEPQIGPMYVTPHNIDERVENLSFTISEAIHMALFGGNG